MTDGRGVDVVLDMVAGDYVAREIECLADDGRIAVIAVQGGTKSTLDTGVVLRKRLTITAPRCGRASWPTRRCWRRRCASRSGRSSKPARSSR